MEPDRIGTKDPCDPPGPPGRGEQPNHGQPDRDDVAANGRGDIGRVKGARAGAIGVGHGGHRVRPVLRPLHGVGVSEVAGADRMRLDTFVGGCLTAAVQQLRGVTDNHGTYECARPARRLPVPDGGHPGRLRRPVASRHRSAHRVLASHTEKVDHRGGVRWFGRM